MSKPVRLRMRRNKGFNLQAHSLGTNGLPALLVSRPTRLGNPFLIKPLPPGRWAVHDDREPFGYTACRNLEGAHRMAVERYREWLTADVIENARDPSSLRDAVCRALPYLRGRNLACYCDLGLACHSDVLLDLANGPRCDELSQR